MITSRQKSGAAILFVALWANLAPAAYSFAAEKKPDLETRVAGLVARFPAQNTPEKDSLAAELLALGGDGISALCRMLAPPGAADDAPVRFALHGAATYVFSPGREPERIMFVRSLAKAIDRQRSKDVQAFLISLIGLAGKKESIGALRRHLIDSRLADPAAQAMAAIGGPEAEAALLKALQSAAAANGVTLIKALGELRSLKATKKLLGYASSEQRELRGAALFALANAGDPRAAGVLGRILVEASALERQQAPALYLLFARRLAESGRKRQAAGICRSLVKNYTAMGESHIASAALALLVAVEGEAALGEILAALDEPARDLRGRALELANEFPGEKVTTQLIERMSRAPAGMQAQILSALEARGDPTALAAVRERLQASQPAVRQAAISAAARLAGSQMIPDLFAILTSGDAEGSAAAELALLRFSKEEIVPQAAELLARGSTRSQAALLRMLAERGASEHLDLIYARIKSEDAEVRSAALRALEPLAEEKNLPRLIALLLEAEETRESSLLQRAVIAASKRIADPEERAGLVLETEGCAKSKEKATLLRLLPWIGGQRALEVTTARTKSEDLEVKTAAIYALSQWRSFDAAAPLLELCRKAESRKFFYLALQGFVRLVGKQELAPEEKFGLLREALELSSLPSEKGLVIQALAEVKTKESLAAVAPFLNDPALKAEAAQAVSRLALPSFSTAQDGLAGIEVVRILKRAYDLIAEDSARRSVNDYIASFLSREGFRPLFNGRDLSGWKGLVGDPPARARMTPQELKTGQAAADAEMRTHWKVEDGVLVFDGAGHSLCTARDYSDFELFVDWKIEPKGDSGIYLRGSPQVQIWDPEQAPEGSGGLYNNQKGPNKPLRRADKAVGEWNTFHIIMRGERVTVYLNNELAVDDVVMENYWEREKPIYASGPIELQAHSTPLCFREIYVRELGR